RAEVLTLAVSHLRRAVSGQRRPRFRKGTEPAVEGVVTGPGPPWFGAAPLTRRVLVSERRRRFPMRTFGGLALAVLLSSAPATSAIAAPLPAPGPYHSGLEVDVSLFHDDLSPYGQWLSDEDNGPVWVPRVSHDWRPYTRGHWVWTDEYGWFWQSDEPY